MRVKKSALLLLLTSTASIAATQARAGAVPGGTYSNLIFVGGGTPITQSGALTVTGTSDFEGGSDSITLTDSANDFQGGVWLIGGAVQIVDSNALSLSMLDTGALTATSFGALNFGYGEINGSLVATSNGGSITQGGALLITGTSTINAGTGAITLTNFGNDFGGAVSLTGGEVKIWDWNSLTLGTLSTGNLTASSLGALNLGSGTISGSLVADSSGGSITQAGPLTIAGTSTLDAGTGSIVLTDAANDFQSSVSLTGSTVLITDSNALSLGTVDAGNLNATSTGALNLGSGTVGGSLIANSNGGAITQVAGGLIVGGTTTLNAGTGAITLTDAANDFAGTVSLTGGPVQISDSNALTLGTLNTGSLTATSFGALNLGSGTINGSLVATSNGGPVTQSGALTVTATTTIDAGTGAITLTNAANDFQGALSLAGGDISIVDSNDLIIAQLDNQGSVSLISGGALTLVPAVIDTGTGDLTLAANGSAFAVNSGLSGGNVSLTGRDGLTLNTNVSAAGSFEAMITNGAIAQTAGALTVSGTSAINAGTGAITLAGAGNDFGGAVSLTGGNVQITDRNALTLGTLSTGNLTASSVGALNLGSGTISGSLVANSNGGSITQSGALTVAGTSTLNAGSGSITLADAANDFQGAVSLTGSTVHITDSTALTLGTVNTGDLTAISTGPLSLGSGTISGDLVAGSNGGLISQAAGGLTVSGTTTLDAGTGSIVLTAANNDFAGAVSLTGGPVQISDSNALTFGTLNIGNLTATSFGALNLGSGTIAGSMLAISNGGAVTQAGALSVTGPMLIDSGMGTISLTNAANDFQAGLVLFGGEIRIRDSNDLEITFLANTGSVSLIAGGSLTLVPPVIDTGTGDLTLASNGGVLVTPVFLSGGNISLTGRDGILLNGDVAASGTFAAASSGAYIGQIAGALTVAGTSVIDAGTGAITLTNASNDFGGAVSLTGGTVQIVDANALTLGTLSTGSLTATSFGALNLGSGTINGNLVATSNGGAVTQSGALTVSGTSAINAGTGAITLTNAANDFQGEMSLTGGDISVRDSNDLVIAAVVNGGSVSLIAGRTLTLAAGDVDTGTGDLTLASNGGIFGTFGTLSGANISLTGRDGIILAHDVTATGTFAATSTNSAIDQTAGALRVGGTSVIDAGTGAITLTDSTNDFRGAVSLTGGAVQIADANALTLGNLNTGALTAVSFGALDLGSGTISGNLVASSNGGAITQAGALTVTGTSTLDAGTGAITLTNAANDFLGAVALTGGSVAITDSNALTLGALDTGALTATSFGALNLGSGAIDGPLVASSNGGAITQASALTVTGTTMLDAGTGAITLTNAANDFGEAVSLIGGAVQITDLNTLTLGTLNTGALTATSFGVLNLGSGTISGDLVASSNGGAITQSDALTVSGTSAIDAGSGAITLTNAANDFQGAVSLTGGDISVRDSNDLVIASIANGGSVSLIAGGTLTLAPGPIDTGTGSLILASNGGTLSTTAALSGGTISLTGRDGITINDDVTASDLLTLNSSQGAISQDTDSVIQAATLTGSALGNVTLTGANQIEELGDFTAADFTLANQLSLQLTGTLTASNVTFDIANGVTVTGAVDAQQTIMKAGSLIVGVDGVGSLAGDLQINSGASLGGSGTVGNTHILSGGSIAQTGSPTTLNVAGNLVLDAGSTYVVNADADGASDLVAVTGTATIVQGAILQFTPQEPMAVGQSYTVLTAAGGVTGEFDFDVPMASAFLGLTDIYTADSVEILFAQLRSFASAALTPNQLATAGGLDSIAGANPLVAALQELPDDRSAQAAFDLLSGEIHPAMRTAMVEESRIPRDAVLQRLARDNSAAGLWAEAVGNWGSNDGRPGETAKLDRETTGIVGGVDTAIGDSAHVGVAAGYTSTDADMAERLSSADLDSYHLLGYLGMRTHGFGVRAGVGYSSTDISTSRSVDFDGFSDNLKANYDGHTLQAFGEIGYQLRVGAGSVEPIAALTYVRAKTDGFVENGGGAALAADAESQKSANSLAGVRFATSRTGAFRLEGLLGWRHAFGDRAPYSHLSFAGSTPFEITAAGLSQDAAVVDMQASLAVSPRVSIGAGYHGELGHRSQDHSARATLTFAF